MGRMKTYITKIGNFEEDMFHLQPHYKDYLHLQRLNYRRDIQISTFTPTWRSMLISDENYKEHRFRLKYENLIIFED